MTRSQIKLGFKSVGTMGDINPLEYGGGIVYEVPGQDPHVDYLVVLEDDNGKEAWELYQFDIEKFAVCEGVIVTESISQAHEGARPVQGTCDGKLPYPIGYYQEWWVRDLDQVCSCMDVDREELVALLCSADTMKRAMGYEYLIGYFGLAEFDNYPNTYRGRMGRRELATRFNYNRKS